MATDHRGAARSRASTPTSDGTDAWTSLITEDASLIAALDRGDDLGAVEDIDKFATVILVAWRVLEPDVRESLAGFYFRSGYELATGRAGRSVDDAKWFALLRRSVWLTQALGDEAVARRFEAALPERVRQEALDVGRGLLMEALREMVP